jgi:sterol desaturase/sphingolipid hydroxylase (fatty acid hydroxylase superfamily)
MDSFLDWAYTLSPPEAFGWLVVLNVGTFALALAAGCLAARVFRARRIVTEAGPLSRKELLYSASGIVVNTLITLAGWFLWRAGILVIRRDGGWYAVVDFLVLVLLMDFGMYVLHRVAHLPWFFPIHRLHHEYDRPWALTLFVVHPLETFGFGMLWLVVIVLYSSSWLGLCLYMAANLAAGMLGHLGVEPFPAWWSRVPVLREVGTSTFHAQHHQDVEHNFGFYTLLWDRLFGTLFPRYDQTFGAALLDAHADGER